MKKYNIPLLGADDIEVRAQQVGKSDGRGWASLLLYKDARVDMRILDDVFGCDGWQRTHEVINGNLFCNVDIWDEEKQIWIRKQDVGVESNTEKQKGQASDAFKRACFNVGIGRELYTAPQIFVDLADNEMRENNGKWAIKNAVKFTVQRIGYNDRGEINDLIITDKKGAVRFTMNDIPRAVTSPPQRRNATLQQPAEGKIIQPDLTCSSCGGTVTQAEHDYSLKKFNKCLCRNCQKAVRT